MADFPSQRVLLHEEEYYLFNLLQLIRLFPKVVMLVLVYYQCLTKF